MVTVKVRIGVRVAVMVEVMVRISGFQVNPTPKNVFSTHYLLLL